MFKKLNAKDIFINSADSNTLYRKKRNLYLFTYSYWICSLILNFHGLFTIQHQNNIL